jgi:hypothetical protein
VRLSVRVLLYRAPLATTAASFTPPTPPGKSRPAQRGPQRGTLRSIIAQAGLTVAEFIELL